MKLHTEPKRRFVEVGLTPQESYLWEYQGSFLQHTVDHISEKEVIL